MKGVIIKRRNDYMSLSREEKKEIKEMFYIKVMKNNNEGDE